MIKKKDVFDIILFDEPAYVTNVNHSRQGKPVPAIDFVPESTHSGKKPLKDKYKVYSPVNGTVANVGWDIGGGGNSITIKTDNGIRIFLCHFRSSLKNRFQIGDKVRKGQYLAIMGTSGFSTGPHVHVQGKKDGQRLSLAALIRELGGPDYRWIDYTIISLIGVIFAVAVFIIVKKSKSKKRIRR